MSRCIHPALISCAICVSGGGVAVSVDGDADGGQPPPERYESEGHPETPFIVFVIRFAKLFVAVAYALRCQMHIKSLTETCSLDCAHSIARTRCGGGDGGGGGSRLRLTSRASRSTCVTRARYVIITRRARHQLSLPPMRDRYARGGGGGGARSLARSITRTRCVAVAKAVAVAVGYAARHARPRHATCASRTRMRVSPPRVARVINVSLLPARDRHARAAAAAALARSLDRAHAVWRWRWRWRWRWWWL